MDIKIEVYVKDDKSEHGSIIRVDVGIPILKAVDFGEQLSSVCRLAMEDFVTQCQRDAGWNFDDLTFE